MEGHVKRKYVGRALGDVKMSVCHIFHLMGQVVVTHDFYLLGVLLISDESDFTSFGQIGVGVFTGDFINPEGEIEILYGKPQRDRAVGIHIGNCQRGFAHVCRKHFQLMVLQVNGDFAQYIGIACLKFLNTAAVIKIDACGCAKQYGVVLMSKAYREYFGLLVVVIASNCEQAHDENQGDCENVK